jgi:superoxide reductase
MKDFGELIYTPEKASGEAITKVESHTPKIECPERVKAGEEFRLKIFVGPHPNTVQHSIRYIEVFFYEEGRVFNPITLAKIDMSPEYVEPNISLSLKLNKSGVIYVIEYCNLHGLWEARREIKVV